MSIIRNGDQYQFHSTPESAAAADSGGSGGHEVAVLGWGQGAQAPKSCPGPRDF